jgi:hypothetical protein
LADARIDGSAALDTDSDGLVDSIDNCPNLSNANQADEDSDAVGDICDGCPIDPSTADTDGDGVFNGCDTNNGAVSSIELFVAFVEPFGILDGNAAPVTNGNLVMPSNGVYRLPTVWADMEFSISGTVVDGPGNTDFVALSMTDNDNARWNCSAAETEAYIEMDPEGASNPQKLASNPIAKLEAGEQVTLRMRPTGTCTVIVPDSTVVLNPLAAIGTTGWSILTSNLPMEIHWAMLVHHE